jgi:hypothetical protein
MNRLFLMFTLISSLLAMSCARPNYVEPSSPNFGGFDKSQKTGSSLLNGRFLMMNWEVYPTEEKVGSFVFKTYRPNLGDGSPIVENIAETIEVELWMPSMGHGSTPITVEQLDIGTYRANRVFFIMGGDWEIRFRLKVGSEIIDQTTIPLRF